MHTIARCQLGLYLPLRNSRSSKAFRLSSAARQTAAPPSHNTDMSTNGTVANGAPAAKKQKVGADAANLHSEHSVVLVLDYGSQYTQLICRRIREIGVFSMMFPGDASMVGGWDGSSSSSDAFLVIATAVTAAVAAAAQHSPLNSCNFVYVPKPCNMSENTRRRLQMFSSTRGVLLMPAHKSCVTRPTAIAATGGQQCPHNCSKCASPVVA